MSYKPVYRRIDPQAPVAEQAPVKEYAREQFLQLLEERCRAGEAHYGTPLTTHNGRSALQDLKEELIDAWQYLCQLEMELKDGGTMSKKLTK
jgi:hypothetical protein